MIRKYIYTIMLTAMAAGAAQAQYNLHNAVLQNSEKDVAHYLSRNEKVNAYDEDGYTPIMYAADICNPEVITLLMDNGANPNLNSLYENEPPALHAAVLRNNPQIVDLMLQYDTTNVDFMDLSHNTALYLAVKNGYLECADVLLYHGANPNSINSRKYTPLQCAAYYNDTAMANLLIKNNCDINQESGKKTAFSIAAERGSMDVAKILVDCNADIRKCYPAHYAAAFGNPEMLEYMHQIGVDFNEDGPDNFSASDLAVMNGRQQNAKLIKQYNGKSQSMLLLRYLSVSEFQEFCKHEFRLGIQMGMHEVRTNSAFYLGYSGRPAYRPALVNVEPGLYYQLRERRNFLHATLEKRFSFHSNSFPDCGAYVQYQFAYASGKFDGSVDMKPKSEMFHVPGAGLYARFRWVGASAGYKYYHYKHALEAPKHVTNISLMFYFGFSHHNYQKTSL